MKSFIAIFCAVLVLPGLAAAELTPEIMQKFRAEAQATEPTSAYTSQPYDRRTMERAVAAELAQTHPTDFDPAVLTDAFRWRAACQKQDWAACTSLAELYLAGDQVWSDQNLAIQLVWLACSGGHGPACHLYTEQIYAAPLTIHLEYPAQAFHEQSCADGDARSCKALYDLFLQDDRELATDYARRGCDLDATMYLCTLILTEAERDANRATILAKFQADCAAEDPAACLKLARLTQKTDSAAAVELYAHACGLGFAEACSSGGRYLSGDRIDTPDPVAARAMYTAACDLEPTRCGTLGVLILKDANADDDAEAKATALFQRACKAAENPATSSSCQHLQAQKTDLFNTALLDLVAPDLRSVTQTAQDACATGDAAACRAIATNLKSQTTTELHKAMMTRALDRACE